MKTYIALFRGINVGGKGVLPMKNLVALLRGMGLESVSTYIQSGNVVFRAADEQAAGLAERISQAVLQKFAFEPTVLLLEAAEIEAAMCANPFPEAEAEPETLHLGFLTARPENPHLEKLAAVKKESERFCLIDRVFYLHAPEGIGRSKLAASSEKLLGVSMTDRNWRTVCRIRDMAREAENGSSVLPKQVQ